jgi:tetratricopeptide (TPR) repeat protein
MNCNVKPVFLSLFLFFGIINLLYAQEVKNLETEIARLKNESKSGTTRQKHSALYELGTLYKLTGNFKDAGDAFHEAALSIPNERDDAALLESASCKIAVGDFEGAESSIKIVLLTNKGNGMEIALARLLQAEVDAFFRDDTAVLEILLEDSALSAYKSQIYYILFIVKGDRKFESALIKEFPESPEARVLTSAPGGNIGGSGNPMWLLFQGMR